MTPQQQFFKAYVETALWSSMDESNDAGGHPLDRNYGPDDIAPRTIQKMKRDAMNFYRENKRLIGSNATRAGHDFWLTRNGHGAGFWDGDWPSRAGDELTKASHAYGSFELYVGDDGLIYHV